MEVLRFLMDNWWITPSVIVCVITAKLCAEANGIEKLMRKSQELRNKVEKKLK